MVCQEHIASHHQLAIPIDPSNDLMIQEEEEVIT